MSEEWPMKIPERLGFAAKREDLEADRNRIKPYSQLSYRARYLLYEDEADDLLRRFDTHYAIDLHLHQRYIHEKEYRERINGGYDAMEAKMRKAGVIPEEEQRLVDWLNEHSR